MAVEVHRTWQGAVAEARRHPACHTPRANWTGWWSRVLHPLRVRRGGGLGVGGHANLTDAAKIVEEWRAMAVQQLTN